MVVGLDLHGMKIEDLPFYGEQIVNSVCRSVTQTDGGFVTADPANPSFHWGSYIQLDDPAAWTVDQLESLYRTRLPHATDRFLFSWNDTLTLQRSTTVRPMFDNAGYALEASVCLVRNATASGEQPVPSSFALRKLVSDDDWERALQNQFLCRMHGSDADYIRLRMQASRRGVAEGHGQWMGAFDGKTLVADLGIFWKGSICRFQAVGTHPDYRGQGLARHLVLETIRDVASRISNPWFIILTGLGDRPQKIYEKCGFRPVATHVGAIRHMKTTV